ncbi:unnamed protein product [Pleuronectes platessa]|uniref:Uncharacterized protein n=1 Tax=Pleuronectes platessa TaxID=8262 RepID=A0A9N7Z6W8_PLEPL|nr:unnamed protein product [Pleuronectes platessa]
MRLPTHLSSDLFPVVSLEETQTLTEQETASLSEIRPVSSLDAALPATLWPCDPATFLPVRMADTPSAEERATTSDLEERSLPRPRYESTMTGARVASGRGLGMEGWKDEGMEG